MTQKDLAEAVAKRAGVSFSQQALQKLEATPNASSRFMHYILDILDEKEGGPRARVKRELDQVDDRHLDAVLAYLTVLKQADTSEGS